MYLIICMAHHSTYLLPKELFFFQLERLAYTARRYDLNHLMLGYLDNWIEPHRANLTNPGFENWLYISWQFGLEAEYLTLANHLAVHYEVNGDNALVPSASTWGRVLDPKAFPPQSIAMIHSCRRQAIADIFSMIRSWIEQAFTSNTCKQHGSLQAQSMCTARNGHGLQRYLIEHGLFPMLDPARESRSVRRLFDILDSPDLTDALTWNDPHDATCSLSETVRNEMKALAGRLPWAVDTDMLNAIRRNGANRAKPNPDPILPTLLVGLKATLSIKDEARDEVNSEVMIEAEDKPKEDVPKVGLRDSVMQDAEEAQVN